MREWTEKHIIELIKRYGGGGGGTGSAAPFFRVVTNSVQDLTDKKPFKVKYNEEVISLKLTKAKYKTAILPAVKDSSGVYRTDKVILFMEVEADYIKDGMLQFGVDFVGVVSTEVEITGPDAAGGYDAKIRGVDIAQIQPVVAYTGGGSKQWGEQMQIVAAYAPALTGTATLL